jgi:5-formyltetrahydrofolate cyclo-ligase
MDKNTLRAALRRTRDSIDPASRARASEQIRRRLLTLAEIEAARRCFVYVSFKSEVDTHALIRDLLDSGRELCVPKMLNRTVMRACRVQRWSDLVPGRLGILTPAGDAFDEEPFDVALTPGLAFTAAGMRIGLGAGYYDRWFAAHKVTHKLALAFEAQLVEALPQEPHDVPVDAIVTEQRVIRIG